MAETPSQVAGGRCTGRRSVLAAMGAVGVTAALGGCSFRTADEVSSQNSDERAAGNPSPAAGELQRQALVETRSVPVGGGALVGQILVVQPRAGVFRAFNALCPHRGARVSPPENGVITCYEHMSTFTDTDGAVTAGPSPRGLTDVRVVVEGTTVILA